MNSVVRWLIIGALAGALSACAGMNAGTTRGTPARVAARSPGVFGELAPPRTVAPAATQNASQLKTALAAATRGDAAAQFVVGSDYLRGAGVQRSLSSAAFWLRKAAAAGIGPAECDLGYLYETGQGVARDYPKAAKWYGKAAALGIANSEYN
ncbi:MAG: tetratricopeptide repeat protein, partial [Steroidobacteraceae bacterium]